MENVVGDPSRGSGGSSSSTTTTTNRRSGNGSRKSSNREPTRNVLRHNSNESLDAMQVLLEGRETETTTTQQQQQQDKPRSRAGLNHSWSKTPTSMSNRRRVAQAAADQMNSSFNNESNGKINNMGSMALNDSAGSLRSNNSNNNNNNEDASFSSRPRNTRRTGRKPGEKITRRSRQQGSSSDLGLIVGDEDEQSVASKVSRSKSVGRRGRDSRNTTTTSSSRRPSSRSRSKSQRRSKSTKARSRRTGKPSSSSSEGLGSTGRRPSSNLSLENLYNESSSSIPPMSPAIDSSAGINRNNKKSNISDGEMELIDFLVSPDPKPVPMTNSQRLGRSVPALDLEYSGRASRTAAAGSGSRSTRRERTMGGGGLSTTTGRDRSSSVRAGTSAESTVQSTSSYKRPPRTSRGVGRSKSDMDGGLRKSLGMSPRKPMSSRQSSAEGVSEKSPRRKKEAPQRSKSDDLLGGLNGFFDSQTSHINGGNRRRKGGSGNRSVASMPARSRRLQRKRSSEDDTPPKQPSSRSTMASTSSEAYEHEEDDQFYDDDIVYSDEESLNDGGRPPSSARSLDRLGGNSSFAEQGSMSHLGNVSIEVALQQHMSRTENLLFDVFPKHIAEALRSGRKVEPENHKCVTIFFSDIVGFTTISSELDPMKVSDLLDRLYNSFDALSLYHDVFKVETIGDAYMAVTNLTKTQPDHCKRIAEFAIDAIRVANQTLIDKEDPGRGFVNIRVGFHSGPVVSNVVGSRNPRFCLFGDTVNTASRMESNSEVNRIHCSDTSAELLREQHPVLKLNPRGGIEVKGKGTMETFWVNEETAAVSQREGSSRSIFKILKGATTKTTGRR